MNQQHNNSYLKAKLMENFKKTTDTFVYSKGTAKLPQFVLCVSGNTAKLLFQLVIYQHQVSEHQQGLYYDELVDEPEYKYYVQLLSANRLQSGPSEVIGEKHDCTKVKTKNAFSFTA